MDHVRWSLVDIASKHFNKCVAVCLNVAEAYNLPKIMINQGIKQPQSSTLSPRCHALGVGEDDGLRWTILTFHLFQRLEELIKLVAVAHVPQH